MITHFIILGSAYSIGKRIALHFVNADSLNEAKAYIKEKCGSDISISTHSIQTFDETWKSVVKFDKYFADVLVINSLEEFSELILNDKELEGIDVAKYIISKYPCTHLKLQKLTYMCYAEYLCQTKERLFKDKIYAYKLGPVIETVYKKYKTKKFINSEDNKKIYDASAKQMSIRSRILASNNGLQKLSSIEETLKKYGSMTASELVNLTHSKNSPWSLSNTDEYNVVINDEKILKYHCNEVI